MYPILFAACLAVSVDGYAPVKSHSIAYAPNNKRAVIHYAKGLSAVVWVESAVYDPATCRLTIQRSDVIFRDRLEAYGLNR